jgi:hypothetical protein
LYCSYIIGIITARYSETRTCAGATAILYHTCELAFQIQMSIPLTTTTLLHLLANSDDDFDVLSVQD